MKEIWGRVWNLRSLRHTYLVSFFLDPAGVRSLSQGATWHFIKRTGLQWLAHQFKEHKEPVRKAYVHRDRKGTNPFTILFYSILFYSILFYSILFYSILFYSFYSRSQTSVRKCGSLEDCERNIKMNLGIAANRIEYHLLKQSSDYDRDQI